MTRIISTADCGNSPKATFIKNFNVAFARRQISELLTMLHKDAVWHIVGQKSLWGREAIQAELESMSAVKISELNLVNAITHGSTAMADGYLETSQGRIAFCEVYQFTSHAKNALIKEFTTYNIQVSSDQ